MSDIRKMTEFETRMFTELTELRAENERLKERNAKLEKVAELGRKLDITYTAASDKTAWITVSFDGDVIEAFSAALAELEGE